MTIVALAVSSMVMVVAMVRFSTAVAAGAEGLPAMKRWGAAYAALWAVIVLIIWRMLTDGDVNARRALAIVTIAAAGWAAFQAFWIWAWRSLGAATDRGTDALRRAAGRVAIAAATLVGVAVIDLVGVSAALRLVARVDRLLLLTIAIAVVGLVLLIVGGVRLARARGTPMTPAEVDDLMRRGTMAQNGAGWSAYRHVGPARGKEADMTLSFSTMKAAWRSGAWRRDRDMQTAFMMTAGGLTAIFGGFAACVVAGPMPVKIMCGGALVYAAFQIVRAVRRA